MGVLQSGKTNAPQEQAEVGGEDNGLIGDELPGSEPASPEEQQARDEIVTAGLGLLFENEQTKKGFLDILNQLSDDPANAMATVTTMIMGQLDDMSKGQLPVELVLPAAAEILDNVGQLINQQGIAQVDQKVLNTATQEMVIGVAEEFGLSPEEAQELLAGYNESDLGGIIASQQTGEENGQPA